MSLTNLTAISKATARLNEMGVEVILPPDIVPLISTALERFALMIAGTKDAQLLRKDFSVVVTGGTGDLATPLAASEPLLQECIGGAYVVTSGGTQLHYLPDRTQLALNRPTMIPYWINDKGTMRTRNTDGSLTSLSTTLTITGQFKPIISSIPTQIEEKFIDVLAGVIKERAEVSSAPQVQ